MTEFLMTETAPARRASGTTPDADAVRLTGLTKRYGEVTAVDGLDLTIRRGEVVALLGPNGAGKSTTIDLLLGLARPDSGTARLCGMRPAEAISRGLVGALLQTGGLLPELTVRETVALAAALYGRRRDVQQVLERAGAAEFARRRVGVLSGGQQQRVRFAMALAADPSLIVLDEPTTGLDVEARRSFWAAMRAETGRGRTVLFATHYLEEADAYADRIVLMRAGRVVADGTAAEIKAAVSGRTIRAHLPGADLGRLSGLPGVDTVEARGDTVLLSCTDSDATLRALLAATPARDIEVVTRGLEDAFMALTTDSPPIAGPATASVTRSAAAAVTAAAVAGSASAAGVAAVGVDAAAGSASAAGTAVAGVDAATGPAGSTTRGTSAVTAEENTK